MPSSSAANRPGAYIRGHQASDVTEPQYRRGWSLWSAMVPEQEIRRQCRMTSAQYVWCLRVGSEEKPAWLHLYSEQVGVMRENAIAAAKLVSGKGIELMRKAVQNGESAAGTLDMILARVRQDMLDAKGKKKGEWEASMPTGETLNAIRTLAHVANVLPSLANSYRSIYGEQMRIPQADEELLAGPGGASGVSAEFLEDLSRMSDEQLDAYIEAGEEPPRAALAPPKDEDAFIDTEVVPPAPEPEKPPVRKKRAKKARKKATARKRSRASGTSADEAG